MTLIDKKICRTRAVDFLCDEALSADARVVRWAIAWLADADIKPGVHSVASYLRTSMAVVRAAVVELINAGYIEWGDHGGRRYSLG